jgi:proteasome lid subunit RPN8/RPN11
MPKLEDRLLKLHNNEVERCGFIMPRNRIVECENISEHPERGFDVSDEEVLKYGDKAIATWHTHPNADNNLSTLDMENFLQWDTIDHYIIGNNGVRKYIIKDGDVLVA